MSGITCKKCDIDLVPVQRTKGISLAGILGAFMFLISLLIMAFNFGLGVLVAIFAILLGVFRGKDTYLVCPRCGEETGPL